MQRMNLGNRMRAAAKVAAPTAAMKKSARKAKAETPAAE